MTLFKAKIVFSDEATFCLFGMIHHCLPLCWNKEGHAVVYMHASSVGWESCEMPGTVLGWWWGVEVKVQDEQQEEVNIPKC